VGFRPTVSDRSGKVVAGDRKIGGCGERESKNVQPGLPVKLLAGFEWKLALGES
jgi:hypothetical protein